MSDHGLSEFVSALASEAPTPGGGGAAALCGALAAALCAMASRLTAGRKKYADRAETLCAIIGQSDALRQRLLRLIDEDAEGFKPLAAAYSLPKGDPQSAAKLREATLTACKAPLAMLRCVCEAAALLERAEGLCSPLLLSDVGCGAALALAAMDCAAMNIFVNTGTLRGDPESDSYEEEAGRLLGEYRPRTEALSASVLRRLQGL